MQDLIHEIRGKRVVPDFDLTNPPFAFTEQGEAMMLFSLFILQRFYRVGIYDPQRCNGNNCNHDKDDSGSRGKKVHR